MSRPYDLYIRYLFTTGLDTPGSVNEKLKSFGLPSISLENLTEVAGYILENVPGGIARQMEKRQYGPDFMPWIEFLNVPELWLDKTDEDKSVLKGVYDIHSDRRYRLSLNALLMRHIPVSDIKQILNLKFSAAFTVKHLDVYRKFFFDPARMRRADWLSFLGKCSNHEKHLYFIALSQNTEAVKAELDLISSIPVSEELAKLLSKSITKANQYMKLSSKESNCEARNWIDTVIKLTDKYEKYRATDSTDFSKSLQMEFQYIDNEFPVPDEMTLTKLSKKLKSKEEQEDSDVRKKEDDGK